MASEAVSSDPSKKITSRNLLVRIDPHDMGTQDLWRDVLEFVRSKGVANAVLMGDGNLLFSSEGKINLKSGMVTLKKLLGLSCTPTRNTSMYPLPDKFVQVSFRDGSCTERISQRCGKMFEDASLRSMISAVVGRERNRTRNRTIVENDTDQLVREGTVSIEMTFEQWEWNRKAKSAIRTGHFRPYGLPTRSGPQLSQTRSFARGKVAWKVCTTKT